MKTLKMTFTVMAMLFTLIMNAQKDLNTEFQNYLNEVYGAFDQGGWEKLKAYYTPTATEVDPDGTITSGLIQLDAYYQNFDVTMESKPKFTYLVKNSKLIGEDVALIVWSGTVEFTVNGETLKNKGTTSAVLVKKEGKWMIEQTQITTVPSEGEKY